jgi:hypothetical protein
MTEEQKREELKCGMLVDHPGHWMMSGTRTKDNDYSFVECWSEAGGTYWQVASMDFFPRSGSTVKSEIGDQIVDTKALAYCEGCYAQWLEKSEEQVSGVESGVMEGNAPARFRIRVTAGDHAGSYVSANSGARLARTAEQGTRRALISNDEISIR